MFKDSLSWLLEPAGGESSKNTIISLHLNEINYESFYILYLCIESIIFMFL